MAKKSDSFYFGNFYACADCAYQAAHLLERVMRDFDPLLIREKLDDMHKVVGYLLEKETITGGEMVAILEGRDPSTVEEAYASTPAENEGFRPSQPSVIEAPAKHISMTSEKIEMPPHRDGDADEPQDEPNEESPPDEPKDEPSDEESK